ncbi:MAG: hypothetical protein EXX96DRAFT_619173 [Benjaminiella poitrasii]|nr:MAG: hypothetical protein EXX96DRAFT_619173 [Benjaminiella poitrasii]
MNVASIARQCTARQISLCTALKRCRKAVTVLEDTSSERVSSDNTPYKPISYPQPQGQKRSNENTMLLDGIPMDQPQGDLFVSDDFDVTDAIYCLKLSLKDHHWKLSSEDRSYLILASTSNWTTVSTAIENIYKIQQPPAPIDTLTNLLSIVDDMICLKLDRDATTVATFVSKLLPVSLDEDINEAELCSRFVDPFLSSLFDDPNQGMYLLWTNESTLEAKQLCNNMRPDITITKTLVVAIFCKNALDEQLMDGVLGIHIVGRTIRFYVLVLPAVATYVMHLLAEIKVPDSIQGLPGFITELPYVLKILHVFDTVCVSSDIPDIIVR